MTVLDVLLGDRKVAELDDIPGEGLATLRYTDEAIDRHGLGTPLLSVRLPVRAERFGGMETRPWLDGLLPEESIREQLAARARIAVEDRFALLRHYGRECAGAVVVVDPRVADPTGTDAGVRWLRPDELTRTVRDLPRAPFGVGLDARIRISLGGLQGKLVVVVDGDRLGVPMGTHPSTHILKPTPTLGDGTERYPGLVSAEAFALEFCRALGIPAPALRILHLEDGDALLVERYDRRRQAGVVRRIHQEDLCQALGLTSIRKYEDALGEPSLGQVADVLGQHAVPALPALVDLVTRVAASLLVGNCDHHAKNWSLVLDQGKVSLAPAYDIVPTALWPEVSTELSLKVGGVALLEQVGRDDLQREAESWGLGARAVSRELDRIAEVFPRALEAALLATRALGADAEVLQACARLVTAQARQLLG